MRACFAVTGIGCACRGRFVGYGRNASRSLERSDRDAMLDGDHQALVDAALPVCGQYGLAVAGGYAIKAHGLVDRPSEDIDFATATAAPIKGNSGRAGHCLPHRRA